MSLSWICPKCNASLTTAGVCPVCGFYNLTTPVSFPHIALVITQPYPLEAAQLPATKMTAEEIKGAQEVAVLLPGKIDRLEAENANLRMNLDVSGALVDAANNLGEKLNKENKMLMDQNVSMKEVIKWYADKKRYLRVKLNDNGDIEYYKELSDTEKDGGEKARTILAELEEGNP